MDALACCALLSMLACSSKSSGISLAAADGAPARVIALTTTAETNIIHATSELPFPGEVAGNVRTARFTVKLVEAVPATARLEAKGACAVDGKVVGFVDHEVRVMKDDKGDFVRLSSLAKGERGTGFFMSPGLVPGVGAVTACEFSFAIAESSDSSVELGAACAEAGSKVTAGKCPDSVIARNRPTDDASVTFSRPSVSFSERGATYWYWATANKPIAGGVRVQEDIRCAPDAHYSSLSYSNNSQRLSVLEPGESVLLYAGTKANWTGPKRCELRLSVGKRATAASADPEDTHRTLFCMDEKAVRPGQCWPPANAAD